MLYLVCTCTCIQIITGLQCTCSFLTTVVAYKYTIDFVVSIWSPNLFDGNRLIHVHVHVGGHLSLTDTYYMQCQYILCTCTCSSKFLTVCVCVFSSARYVTVGRMSRCCYSVTAVIRGHTPTAARYVHSLYNYK